MHNSPGTALITGAAGGIGAAFARQLASKGYNLILVGKRVERLVALATGLQDHHPISAEVIGADLSNPTDVERVEKLTAGLESLDMLINNAGFRIPGKFSESDVTKHLEMIHVHVITTVRLTRAALPGMIVRRRGAIINVSSFVTFLPIGGVTYRATKAYLNAFSEALQAELRGTGVRVQALCPGFTSNTDFYDMPEYEAFDRSQIPKALWMPAEEVVAKSLKALRRSQVVYIPGFKNRLLVALARMLTLPGRV